MATSPGGLGFPPGHTWDACRSGRNGLVQAGSWPLSAPAMGEDPESRLSRRSCVETSAQRRESRSDKSASGDRMRVEGTGGQDEGTRPRVREDRTGVSRREPSPQGLSAGVGSPRPLSTRRHRGCPQCHPSPAQALCEEVSQAACASDRQAAVSVSIRMAEPPRPPGDWAQERAAPAWHGGEPGLTLLCTKALNQGVNSSQGTTAPMG